MADDSERTAVSAPGEAGAAGGRAYEDFEAGATYPHWPGRTVTETDNIWFTLLTMNTHPLHFDHAYAAGTGFGCIADRPHVGSLLAAPPGAPA